MSNKNTDIRFKRSISDYAKLIKQNLLFGEPFLIDQTKGPVSKICNAYLSLGRKPYGDETASDVTIENSPIIKGLSKYNADRMVFFKDDSAGNITTIVTEDGREIPSGAISATAKTEPNPGDTTKYHILCQPDNSNNIVKFTFEDAGIFFDGKGVMHGAAWNDYAELRKAYLTAEPGMVVCDTEDGLCESRERLQPCPHVVSDTYGQIIGKVDEDKLPIAIAGRVLVYVNEDKDNINIGDCLCADVNGKASIMTRQEIINYPDRILGTVCEIPKDEKWNDVEIDGRIWINIK